MTTPSTDPICVRNAHLQHILMGRRNLFDGDRDHRQLTKDELIDALMVLYDDCSADVTKKDVPTVNFVDKYQPIVTKLKKLRVNIGDFEQKKVIGRGHFGEVHLVKEKQTGNVYAMKVMKKSETLAKQNIAFYEEEKDIMAKATSEWLTSLHCSFQDHEKLYLVMEFHPGGDLLSLLSRRDGSLNEDDARFYIAEMILALHSLHTMGYVHRDIKPENVLLDRLGHIKLADFGSSAKLDSTGLVRNEMAVGTADYIAPEVLTSMNNVGLLAGGYGVECDFWSLGVMAYEMVYGSTPFGAEKISTTYGNIMNYKNCLEFPSSPSVSAEFRSLVNGLLCDAKTRMGYQQLIAHPFFNSVDWNSLREKSPPSVPIVTSLDDTSNFEEFDSEGHLASTINLKGTQEMSGKNLPFIGFTFVKDGNIALGRTEFPQFHDKRIGELEEELKTKTKEISELRKQKLLLEQDKGKQIQLESLQKKVQRLEAERDTLQQKLASVQREAERQRRAAEFEKSERQSQEVKTLEIVQDLKRNFEKKIDTCQKDLRNEVKVWKEALAESELKVKDQAELLKTANTELLNLAESCNAWKVKANKYKEMASRGQRVGEKRASICMPPPSDSLNQVKQQLEREMLQKAEMKQKVQELEDRIRDAENKFCKRLADEERQWMTKAITREDEYRNKLHNLEEKVIRQKETRIKELEHRLETQLAECRVFKERSEKLQKSLDETLQWRNSFESSFGIREGELEKRIRELEADLRSAADTKIELQQRLAESSVRETAQVEKFETMVINMHDAVEKLEQKNRDDVARLEKQNQELVVQLSHYEASASAAASAPAKANESEELKGQKALLETQIAKLEQQLERTRENLTLEREKSRQTSDELRKKIKELSDTQIDLRIANRETKTSEAEVAKLKEGAKSWQDKLKVKDEEIQQTKAELEKSKNELADAQRALEQKQKAQTNCEKDLEEANKVASTARELRRELQRAKDEMSLCQRQKTLVEAEVKGAEERASRHVEEKRALQKLLDEEKEKAQALEKDMTLLKETMTMMDEQLQDFENLMQSSSKKESDFEGEKGKLSEEIQRLKQEVRNAKQQLNEEKSLKLFTESKLRDVESRLKSCEADSEERVSSLRKETNESANIASKLKEQVADLEHQLNETEAAVDSMSRKIASLNDDNIRLQEESTALRTQLISVKNSNAMLSEGLEEAIRKGEKYKTQIVQLETQIDTTRVMTKEREHKLESTVAQQTKLIDFLQAKAEPKKKQTFTDKLFGTHKKENQPSIPVAYRELEASLEKKTTQCRSLMEQLNKCKAELVAAKAEAAASHKTTSAKELNRVAALADPIRCQSATPLQQRTLSRITQSPGTQSSSPSSASLGPASQRMHHNIPHRLHSQMVVRATNCAVCLDSVHFGRQVSICQDCGATAHTKCVAHLPSTCGLPMGLAEHFGAVIGQEPTSKSGEATAPAPSANNTKGWVKVPRPGKANCWERKFMQFNGSKLCIYDQEPTSDKMEPTDSFELRPNDGSTVAIHSAVAQSEGLTVAKTDVPYLFMIEAVPLTTCWPGRTLFVMALNFMDKKAWVSALESVTMQGGGSNVTALQLHRKPKLVLRLNDPIDVNCTLAISEGVLLVGAKEGLFSYHLEDNRRDLVKIEGVTNVLQIVVVPKLSTVLMIVGEDRQLVFTELRVLQGCANAVQISKPTLEVEPVPGCEDIHLFDVSNLEQDNIFLCAANQGRVKLFKWSGSSRSFVLRKELIVSESCSCIHFNEHSVLVGCDRFYEVDLGNYAAEEFLDASDSSLAYAVFGLKQIHSFPVAILEVTPRKGETEFLLCYHEFGIFVDGYGRRSRPDDVKWTRLPLAFAYRGPYLFVLHFNSVEVIRLTPTAFRSSSSKSEVKSDAAQVAQLPPSVFIEIPSPRYLGRTPENGSIYVFSNDNQVMDIVQIDAPVVLGEKDRAPQPDEISLSESEFSITPSIAKMLDHSNDSIDSSTSAATSTSPFKRVPSSREPASSSKRVKFESDL